MAPSISRSLAWRLRRHGLDPAAAPRTATDVARRVLAIRGWPAETADLVVCVRQRRPDPGDLERALAAGELIKSYALRGGSHVFVPEIAALILSVRTATRIWETRRWQQQGGFTIEDWEPVRAEVCAVLAEGPMTRAEISTRLAAGPLASLAAAATGAGADSLYKPLHWWGDICFGPPRDGKSTFRLLRGDPRWPGLPAVEEAGPTLIARYLGAYGPATPENLHYWFTEGLGVPGRRVQQWLSDLDPEVVTLSGDEGDAYLLAADLEELAAAEPSAMIRLLPAYDPWIMGPGTSDTRLIASHRRDLFSRGANPVLSSGVVAGTWRLRGRTVEVSWFGESGDPPAGALEVAAQGLPNARSDASEVVVSVT